MADVLLADAESYSLVDLDDMDELLDSFWRV